MGPDDYFKKQLNQYENNNTCNDNNDINKNNNNDNKNNDNDNNDNNNTIVYSQHIFINYYFGIGNIFMQKTKWQQNQSKEQWTDGD